MVTPLKVGDSLKEVNGLVLLLLSVSDNTIQVRVSNVGSWDRLILNQEYEMRKIQNEIYTFVDNSLPWMILSVVNNEWRLLHYR